VLFGCCARGQPTTRGGYSQDAPRACRLWTRRAARLNCACPGAPRRCKLTSSTRSHVSSCPVCASESVFLSPPIRQRLQTETQRHQSPPIRLLACKWSSFVHVRRRLAIQSCHDVSQFQPRVLAVTCLSGSAWGLRGLRGREHTREVGSIHALHSRTCEYVSCTCIR
jgi:hypothetical protein